MAVVKALVEAHGGTVAVESQGPGQGSAFSVVLPFPRGAETGDGYPSCQPGSTLIPVTGSV